MRRKYDGAYCRIKIRGCCCTEFFFSVLDSQQTVKLNVQLSLRSGELLTRSPVLQNEKNKKSVEDKDIKTGKKNRFVMKPAGSSTVGDVTVPTLCPWLSSAFF